MIVTAGFALTRTAFLVWSSSTCTALLPPEVGPGPPPTPIKPTLESSALTEQHSNDLKVEAEMLRSSIASAIRSDPTIAGSILRLAFHDAATLEYRPPFLDAKSPSRTGGPNGSVIYELNGNRHENRALGRPLRIVLGSMEETGSTLSLADAIALAGAAAVECASGPFIPIRLGRLDATYADPAKLRVPVRKKTDRSKVETTLPSPGLDSDGLRSYFKRLGLSEEEMVALSGAHDLGRHVTLTGMSRGCLKHLTVQCLEDAPVSVPFVTSEPDTLSNLYFKELLRWNDRSIEMGEVAFIPTDVALVVDNGLRRHVVRFAHDQDYFFRVFARAYQKLVDTTATTIERF